MENRCVCCGEIIPEGRMVCPKCESATNDIKKGKNDAIVCWLRSVKIHEKKIEALLEEAERQKSLLEKVTTTFDKTPVGGSRDNDKFGAAVAKLVDLQERISESVEIHAELTGKVLDVVNRICSHDEFSVIYSRYFQNKPWEIIAAELATTPRNVFYTHRKALESVERITKAEGINIDNV